MPQSNKSGLRKLSTRLSKKKPRSNSRGRSPKKTMKKQHDCKNLIANYRDFITEVVRSRSDISEVAKEQMIALFKAELKTDKYKSLQLGVAYNDIVQKSEKEQRKDMVDYLEMQNTGKSRDKLEKMNTSQLRNLYEEYGADFRRGVNPDTRVPF